MEFADIPNEIILYMCDISHHNYMGLYRLNKTYHTMLSGQKSKMIAKYLVLIKTETKINNKNSQIEHTTIGNNRNGYYAQTYVASVVYNYRWYYGVPTRILESVTGAYRDNAKHGVWEKKAWNTVVKRIVYCFGKEIIRYNFNRDGSIKFILHYDDNGEMIYGEYPNSGMTIYYKSGMMITT